jgi:glycosyltransferase involved in cell wall biosynthesis
MCVDGSVGEGHGLTTCVAHISFTRAQSLPDGWRLVDFRLAVGLILSLGRERAAPFLTHGHGLHTGMTRILHVIPGLTGGGAERQLTILATQQVERGDSVHIALLRPHTAGGIEESGVAVHQLRASGNHDPLLFWNMNAIMRKTRPQIVQTWLTLPDVVGGGVALLRRTPWVLSERSEAAGYPPTWKNRARSRLARKSSAIVANSEGGARYWVSQGVPSSHLTVIPNAVASSSASPAAPSALPPGFHDRPLVLFGGRLSDEKNPLVLVDALARAFATSNAVALLCGSGPCEQEMAARIRSHQMQDRIVLAGHRTDLPALLQRAQLCVAISLYEGNPNVVLEAMAVGCPLIVSDIPAYTQLLDNTCARIVPVRDVSAIASAIVAVLAEPQAAAARAVLAKARLINRTPKDLADAHENVYARLV